jgi:hypothetical protein
MIELFEANVSVDLIVKRMIELFEANGICRSDCGDVGTEVGETGWGEAVVTLSKIMLTRFFPL